MTDYYDDRETQAPEAREAALMAALPGQLAHAKGNATGFAATLADVEPNGVTSREALASVPVLRKSDLIVRQGGSPPLGGLAATPLQDLARLFLSPGPIAEPQGRGTDWWRLARALYAAGLRQGDIVQNCFSYHLTPAGMMLDGAAQAIGCVLVPGGIGQTDLQIEAMAHFRVSAYTGTPDFLKILLDKAAEKGADISSLTKALVSGGAMPPSLRREIHDRGVSVLQCYATADLGLIAYESAAQEGMIVNEGLIVEIVRPGTGDPVPEGEVGEVVVTTLNRDYPLIRLATGDMSATLPGLSPCGRTAPRIKGWLGRADQTTKVRGMFIHPRQVAEVVKRHPEIVKARLVVTSRDNRDSMTLTCETANTEAATDAIAATVQSVCKVRADVVLVAPGSLPNDGKVIDDQRSYE